ncbi:MAG: phosphate-starvation-inducible PsiE family protein [Coriobacteriia bacterium]|nr:phosphate-starvation-inducible PsiE family protein [Coriobacteriia bacterium]
MIERIYDKIVYLIEVAVAGILVILAGLSLWALLATIYHIISGGVLFERTVFVSTVSIVLDVFILVELFRIALAYMKHANVVPTVLEAALVAIARKFVMFEPAANISALYYALGLSALILSVAVSWYLMMRTAALASKEDINDFIFPDSEENK